jgi:hypothetical protein
MSARLEAEDGAAIVAEAMARYKGSVETFKAVNALAESLAEGLPRGLPEGLNAQVYEESALPLLQVQIKAAKVAVARAKAAAAVALEHIAAYCTVARAEASAVPQQRDSAWLPTGAVPLTDQSPLLPTCTLSPTAASIQRLLQERVGDIAQHIVTAMGSGSVTLFGGAAGKLQQLLLVKGDGPAHVGEAQRKLKDLDIACGYRPPAALLKALHDCGWRAFGSCFYVRHTWRPAGHAFCLRVIKYKIPGSPPGFPFIEFSCDMTLPTLLPATHQGARELALYKLVTGDTTLGVTLGLGEAAVAEAAGGEGGGGGMAVEAPAAQPAPLAFHMLPHTPTWPGCPPRLHPTATGQGELTTLELLTRASVLRKGVCKDPRVVRRRLAALYQALLLLAAAGGRGGALDALGLNDAADEDVARLQAARYGNGTAPCCQCHGRQEGDTLLRGRGGSTIHVECQKGTVPLSSSQQPGGERRSMRWLEQHLAELKLEALLQLRRGEGYGLPRFMKRSLRRLSFGQTVDATRLFFMLPTLLRKGSAAGHALHPFFLGMGFTPAWCGDLALAMEAPPEGNPYSALAATRSANAALSRSLASTFQAQQGSMEGEEMEEGGGEAAQQQQQQQQQRGHQHQHQHMPAAAQLQALQAALGALLRGRGSAFLRLECDLGVYLPVFALVSPAIAIPEGWWGRIVTEAAATLYKAGHQLDSLTARFDMGLDNTAPNPALPRRLAALQGKVRALLRGYLMYSLDQAEVEKRRGTEDYSAARQALLVELLQDHNVRRPMRSANGRFEDATRTVAAHTPNAAALRAHAEVLAVKHAHGLPDNHYATLGEELVASPGRLLVSTAASALHGQPRLQQAAVQRHAAGQRAAAGEARQLHEDLRELEFAVVLVLGRAMRGLPPVEAPPLHGDSEDSGGEDGGGMGDVRKGSSEGAASGEGGGSSKSTAAAAPPSSSSSSSASAGGGGGCGPGGSGTTTSTSAAERAARLVSHKAAAKEAREAVVPAEAACRRAQEAHDALLARSGEGMEAEEEEAAKDKLRKMQSELSIKQAKASQLSKTAAHAKRRSNAKAASQRAFLARSSPAAAAPPPATTAAPSPLAAFLLQLRAELRRRRVQVYVGDWGVPSGQSTKCTKFGWEMFQAGGEAGWFDVYGVCEAFGSRTCQGDTPPFHQFVPPPAAAAAQAAGGGGEGGAGGEEGGAGGGGGGGGGGGAGGALKISTRGLRFPTPSPLQGLGDAIIALHLGAAAAGPVRQCMGVRGYGCNLEKCYHPCHNAQHATWRRGGPRCIPHDVIGVLNCRIIVEGLPGPGGVPILGNPAAPYLERHHAYFRGSFGQRLFKRPSNIVTVGLGFVYAKQ